MNQLGIAQFARGITVHRGAGCFSAVGPVAALVDSSNFPSIGVRISDEDVCGRKHVPALRCSAAVRHLLASCADQVRPRVWVGPMDARATA
jgi:hypothetical protein